MSKASDWSDLVGDFKRPRFSSARISAEVNDHGDLARVEIETQAIPPDEALSFGRWLLDTFDDAAPSNVGRAQ